MSIIHIDDPADPRFEHCLYIRERDLVDREGHFIVEGNVVLNVLFEAHRFEENSVLVLKNCLAAMASSNWRYHLQARLISATLDAQSNWHFISAPKAKAFRSLC